MIKEAPYYWVVCDDCGVSAQEGSEHAAWSEAEHALSTAEESDWFVGKPGPHYCPLCSVRRIVCTVCFEQITDSTDTAKTSGWAYDVEADEWVCPKCDVAEYDVEAAAKA